MPWLVRDGDVLATLEVAQSRRERRRGLLGRDHVEGALLLPRTRAVHSVGMRMPIDVAFCRRDGDSLIVIRTLRMRPHRLSRPCLRASCVLEGAAGAFDRWELRPGDRLEIKS